MSKVHRAIFLDRDGVINKEREDYVKTVEELEIFPEVAESVINLKSVGFLVIVITNQSAVNRKLTTHENIDKIHSAIQKHLEEKGTLIDRFYYCPHRPDENCGCRKPKPGLIIQAANELNIDLKSSWMIGDNDSDIEAATSIGCKAIKVDKNLTLREAVQSILK